MSNEECVAFVRKRLKPGVRPSLVAEQLFDECITEDPKKTQGLGGDNMTCIIVALK
jgi:hypothetical protein